MFQKRRIFWAKNILDFDLPSTENIQSKKLPKPKTAILKNTLKLSFFQKVLT